jgi:tripartite-type tricarboxylate transporter receptor subunit TctC
MASRWISVAVIILALAPVAVLSQQNYPNRAIRVVLPVPPGAGVDTILRKAGDSLLPRLGQPFVLENRASANMVTGADACAKSVPDGYTICGLSALSISLNPQTILKLPYDAERDFKPVVNMFVLRGGIITKAALAVNSVAELQALAVAKPGALNFGSLGPFSTNDISRQLIEERWSTKLAGIPYKGGPAIINGLVGGEIDFSLIGVYNAIGPLKGGKVKLLAIEGHRRSPIFPEVPVLAEVGLDGIVPLEPWWGVLVPARTPDAIVRRLNSEFVRLFHEPSFVEFLDGQFVEIAAGTPEEFAAYIKQSRAAAQEMVKKYNIPRE